VERRFINEHEVEIMFEDENDICEDQTREVLHHE